MHYHTKANRLFPLHPEALVAVADYNYNANILLTGLGLYLGLELGYTTFYYY
jgi:hypothetical protein